MTESEDPVLTSAAEAVTDGLVVDWSGLKSRNPTLGEDLGAMEAMAEVARAYHALREAGLVPPD